MLESVVLSLIFLDVGIMAMLLGRASKHLLPDQTLVEEENYLPIIPQIRNQVKSMNEPINRANRGVEVNAQANLQSDSQSDSQLWQWEFKIVRGSINSFRGREALHYVCEQERQAGWILFEKLDNQRLRFRRPIGARKVDHLCRQDPYRTYYGMPPEISSIISLLVVLALLGIPTYWGFGFIRKQFAEMESKPIEVSPNLPKQPSSK
jgi:hypothetical protein